VDGFSEVESSSELETKDAALFLGFI
jgi:hypothetical protein